MVYLVRTSEFLGDWKQSEKAWEIWSELISYVGKNYDQVRESYLMTNIAGPTDQIHWVLTFESLADEEEFAVKAFHDPRYMESMKKVDGLLTAPVDRLYRRET